MGCWEIPGLWSVTVHKESSACQYGVFAARTALEFWPQAGGFISILLIVTLLTNFSYIVKEFSQVHQQVERVHVRAWLWPRADWRPSGAGRTIALQSPGEELGAVLDCSQVPISSSIVGMLRFALQVFNNYEMISHIVVQVARVGQVINLSDRSHLCGRLSISVLSQDTTQVE